MHRVHVPSGELGCHHASANSPMVGAMPHVQRRGQGIVMPLPSVRLSPPAPIKHPALFLAADYSCGPEAVRDHRRDEEFAIRFPFLDPLVIGDFFLGHIDGEQSVSVCAFVQEARRRTTPRCVRCQSCTSPSRRETLRPE